MISGVGGFSLGTPDALRVMAFLLFLHEATIAGTRPAHPALPDLVASAPKVSCRRTLSGAFEKKVAATPCDTKLAPIGANMLHALAGPTSHAREEFPATGKNFRRRGRTSDAEEELPTPRKSFRRRGRTSGAEEELPAPRKNFRRLGRTSGAEERTSGAEEELPART